MTGITSYLGLGSNVGDKLHNLKSALNLLDNTEGIYVRIVSSLYETDPIGYTDQEPFYNLVVKIDTMLCASRLLNSILFIEELIGRKRTIRWGPRTIDIDILLYGEKIISTDKLKVPHPRIGERAFVLIPLREVAGNIMIPGYNYYIEDQLSVTAKQNYKKLNLIVR